MEAGLTCSKVHFWVSVPSSPHMTHFEPTCVGSPVVSSIMEEPSAMMK